MRVFVWEDMRVSHLYIARDAFSERERFQFYKLIFYFDDPEICRYISLSAAFSAKNILSNTRSSFPSRETQKAENWLEIFNEVDQFPPIFR